jgi:2-polyprenyl-6-methoxyphenol hydroxylase-like FAD-dependent oxidoreductase
MVTDPQAAPFTIAIIGGSLAGLTLSIGLTRFRISHKIYEAAKCFSEIGAGIAMGPNAVYALALIDPRLRECYDRCATFNEREDQRELFFDIRYGMESDKSGAVKYTSRCTHDVLRVLTCPDSETSSQVLIATIMTRARRDAVVSIARGSWMK